MPPCARSATMPHRARSATMPHRARSATMPQCDRAYGGRCGPPPESVSHCFDRHMDPQTHQAVTRWLSSRAVQDLATSDMAQIDIDELFDEPPEYAVRVGL